MWQNYIASRRKQRDGIMSSIRSLSTGSLFLPGFLPFHRLLFSTFTFDRSEHFLHAILIRPILLRLFLLFYSGKEA